MPFPAIVDLLPHEPPMVLLDRIVHWKDDTVHCQVHLREDSMFVHRGQVQEVVSLEYMAQAVGVCTALRTLAREKPLQRGYLVAVRQLRLSGETLAVGDVLDVTASLSYDGDALGVFSAEVSRGGQSLALGMLSVYRTDDANRECQ